MYSYIIFFLLMLILVNEVVWEGEETEVKKVESDMRMLKKVGTGTTNAETNTVTNTNNRLMIFSLHFSFC